MSFLLTILMGVVPMVNKQLFDLYIDDGIVIAPFERIQDYVDSHSLTILSWLTADLSVILDNMYLTQHSGSKYPSIVVQRMMKIYNDDVDDAMNNIAETLVQKFAEKWDKLYSAITTNYKPLENYDMEQTETPDITHTKTTQTETVTSITDDVTGNDVYGFNSSSPVPNNKVTRNGTSTVSNDPDNNVETNTESGTRGLTRHGNIGVTTSQQMLQSEIDLRNNYNFLNNIMDDVDSILCNLVY